MTGGSEPLVVAGGRGIFWNIWEYSGTLLEYFGKVQARRLGAASAVVGRSVWVSVCGVAH
eukprot:2900364-Pyramimonas_sp.AAC.1